MTIKRVDFSPNSFSGSPIEANAIEAAPPTSSTVIAFENGASIPAPGGVFTAGIYCKAVTQPVTWMLKGRISIGGIVGDLITIKTATQASGSSSFTKIEIADNVFMPDEFQVFWTAPSGAAATCQLAFKLG